MDLASIIGMAVCAFMVVFGMVYGADGINFGAMKNFLDAQSAIITFGGAFCAVLVMNTVKDFLAGLKSIKVIFKTPQLDTVEIIKKIIDLSNVARKEGLLSLEEAAGDINDDFLKKGIMLVVDGTDPELVRAIMETEMGAIEGRHKQKVKFWMDVASMGPAWGMIGTLIGLVNMLQNMSDAAAIGPAMAVALITTLYGSMLANWVATPCATKLGAFNDAELMLKEIMIEGLLSIQAGENPRVIEEKLKSFLAPSERPAGEGEGGE